jgi:molecular chaperone DnaK
VANVRAPNLPKNVGAPATPQSFTFEKGAATISFSGVPGPVAAPPNAGPKLDLPPLKPRTVPKPRAPTEPMVFELDDVDEITEPLPNRTDRAPPLQGADIDGDWGVTNDIVSAPDVDLALPSGPPHSSDQPHLTTDLFSGIELGGNGRSLELDPSRFAQGTAIKANAASPLLIDVTPLSLGVETAGGYADVIIPANSPVPCEKTRTFLTGRDGQTVVSIRVSQGESTRFAENTRLGDLVISDLRSGRRGDVKIEVTFELDADGILNVRALDVDTGRATTATMRLSGANTDADDVGAMAARQAQHKVV